MRLNLTQLLLIFVVDTICFLSLQGQSAWQTNGNSLSNNGKLGSTNNMDVGLITNNLPRFVVKANGFVGIGTLTPGKPFEVNGDVRFNQDLSVGGEGIFNNGLVVRNGLSLLGGNIFVNGNITAGNGQFNGFLKIGSYTLPAERGLNGQVLKINGTGLVSWANDATGIYTAGPGINIVGSTISNTAPDQPVSIVAGSGIAVTGSYPNFNIATTGAGGNSQWTSSGSNIYYNTGNVGIALSNPNYKLDINGDINISAGHFLRMDGDPVLKYHNGNIFVGFDAGHSNTGFGNVGTGYHALYATTSGGNNTAAGYEAMANNTSGSSNIAYGYQSLFSNTTGNTNISIGQESLYSNTTGFGNVAIGHQALLTNTSGGLNTSIGHSSMGNNTTGSLNTAIGNQSLVGNTTGNSNTAVGSTALRSNTTGASNTAIGSSALFLNTTGINNTASGFNALSTNESGSENTAGGAASLFHNTTGSDNCAFGMNALSFNTVGNNNTAIGKEAMYANNDGGSNTAYGVSTLHSNQSGNNNTAIGGAALFANVSGERNTAIGYSSLGGNGSDNTAVGTSALLGTTTGSGNVATGANALLMNGTGSQNTAAGNSAAFRTTTGTSNTAIGYQTLYGNETGDFNTAIGTAAGTLQANLSNTTTLGNGARVSASNEVRLGNDDVVSIGGIVDWTSLSDGRVKKNIKQDVPGLTFINKLTPITYHINLQAEEKILQSAKIDNKSAKSVAPTQAQLKARETKEEIVYTGFVAQDVEKAAKELKYDFSGVDAAKNQNDLYGLRYSQFVVPLVKAVQELSEKNENLTKKNQELEKRLQRLEERIATNTDYKTGSTPFNHSSAYLEQNAPNPYRNATVIRYYLPIDAFNAKIIIADMTGNIIKTQILNSNGKGQVILDAGSLSSGTYTYTLWTDNVQVDTKKMIITR